MIATADAFGNEELAIGQYLNCLYEILPGAVVIQNKDNKHSIVSSVNKGKFGERIEDLRSNFKKVRKILEIAKVIGDSD